MKKHPLYNTIMKNIILQLSQKSHLDDKVLRKIKTGNVKNVIPGLPSNRDLLSTYNRMVEEKELKRSKEVEMVLRTRPIRSLSGIVNVSVLTKPYPCPGKCIFCPLEEGMPKSYISGEPAADRAHSLSFDPYLQTRQRLDALKSQGHPTDKVELRVVGGSWSFYPKDYREEFIRQCFLAANQDDTNSKKSLEEVQKENEIAQSRLVGVSVETRSDMIDEEEIRDLRRLGVTFVELGVQTIFDDVHERNKTGVTVDTIAKATKLLKDSGFKVLCQVMPNLLGSNYERDIEMFSILFKDSRFKPDWIKIYPCVVLKNTPLYDIHLEGSYTPYDQDNLINLLIEIKRKVPYWTRIARIYRDIPSDKIESGSKALNMREMVQKRLTENNESCKCIRCREVRDRFDQNEKVVLYREDYDSSQGKEIFLSLENKDRAKLFSFLRLRHTKDTFLPVLDNSSIVRELHTFGPQVPLSGSERGVQHRGLGTRLMKEAERITIEELKLPKISVISGIGVRGYYKSLGYSLEGTYMIKRLGS